MQIRIGAYMTKDGYEWFRRRILTTLVYKEAKIMMRKKIWTRKGILPRVRTFLWIMVHRKLLIINMTYGMVPKMNSPSICYSSTQYHEPHGTPCNLWAWDYRWAGPTPYYPICNIFWCLSNARYKELFSAK